MALNPSSNRTARRPLNPSSNRTARRPWFPNLGDGPYDDLAFPNLGDGPYDDLAKDQIRHGIMPAKEE